jgi:hypothetical protein
MNISLVLNKINIALRNFTRDILHLLRQKNLYKLDEH